MAKPINTGGPRARELRLRVKQVLVFISTTSARATAIPPELVARMKRFSPEDEPATPQTRNPSAKRRVQKPV